MLANLKKFVLDLLFPIQCLGCGQYDEWLCCDCFKKIKFGSDLTPSLLKNYKPYLEDVWVATDYSQKIIQRALQNYKYNFIIELGRPLGQLLVEYLKTSNKNINFDFIVPVPLAKKRLVWRGFNQAEILAKTVGDFLGLPVATKLIFRKKYTRPQVGLAAKDRRLNVSGIFDLKQNQHILDKNILLIDDVVTTGSTLGECAKVLKKAGAKRIYGLVVAQG